MNMLSSADRELRWLKWIFNIFIPDLVLSVSLCAFSVTLSVSSYLFVTQRNTEVAQRATELYEYYLTFNYLEKY